MRESRTQRIRHLTYNIVFVSLTSRVTLLYHPWWDHGPCKIYKVLLVREVERGIKGSRREKGLFNF